jgi:hypothetical protein
LQQHLNDSISRVQLTLSKHPSGDSLPSRPLSRNQGLSHFGTIPLKKRGTALDTKPSLVVAPQQHQTLNTETLPDPSGKVWSFEAIERRIKLKKEKRLVERQLEELRNLFSREIKRHLDDEDAKER